MSATRLALPLLCILSAPAWADCSTFGETSCGTVLNAGGASALFRRAPITPPPFAVGEILPDGYYVLLNTEYYGLPPVESEWLYYRVERHVLRVERNSRVILADATGEINRAF